MTFTLKSLVHVGAPLVLMQLVFLLYQANGVMAMDVDCVEYFAGCQAVPWLELVFSGICCH